MVTSAAKKSGPPKELNVRLKYRGNKSSAAQFEQTPPREGTESGGHSLPTLKWPFLASCMLLIRQISGSVKLKRKINVFPPDQSWNILTEWPWDVLRGSMDGTFQHSIIGYAEAGKKNYLLLEKNRRLAGMADRRSRWWNVLRSLF